ncbi:MAG: hypothetical protein WC082_03635 [Victivallales bacterium]
MKKFILLLLTLSLAGCLTPHAFRGEYSKKLGPFTTYEITDYKDGFKLDMCYNKLETEGTSNASKFHARNRIKDLALWIAEARKRKLKPINIKDIESKYYHNSVTRKTRWRGELRVYYAN